MQKNKIILIVTSLIILIIISFNLKNLSLNNFKERIQERVKSEKKYIKSVMKTQLDKIKKIDENVYQIVLEQYNEIDAVKEKKDIEKLTKIEQVITSVIEKDDINKRLTMNLFKSILSNKYFGQPSFLNVVNTKLSYEEQENLMYKDYISNINVNLFICSNSIWIKRS